MSKTYLNADPDKTNFDNKITAEEISNITPLTEMPLVHDIFFKEDFVLYTDPENKIDTVLREGADFELSFQDSIASEQSNRQCYRRIIFLKSFDVVFADYHAYGDFVTAETINDLNEIAKEAIDTAKDTAENLDDHQKDHAPHGATAENMAGRMPVRNARGTFNTGAPQEDTEIARLAEIKEEARAREDGDNQLAEYISRINEMIPEEANDENPLADKDFVSDIVQSAVASIPQGLNPPRRIELESQLAILHPTLTADDIGLFYIIQTMDVSAAGKTGKAWVNYQDGDSNNPVIWYKVYDQYYSEDGISVILSPTGQLKVSTAWLKDILAPLLDGKLDKNGTAFDSERLGGIAAGSYATQSWVIEQMNNTPEELPNVDAIYFRLPGMKTPFDFYGGGNWENISTLFAGLFFRIEGGNASSFGSGTQEEAVPNLARHAWNTAAFAPSGADNIFFSSGTQGQQFYGNTGFNQNIISYDFSRGNATYGRRNEVAPNNTTIQIWILRSK